MCVQNTHLYVFCVGTGGLVVVVEGQPLLSTPSYVNRITETQRLSASLPFAQSLFLENKEQRSEGFHIMQCPTTDWVETMSGVGATGVDVMVRLCACLSVCVLFSLFLFPLSSLFSRAFSHKVMELSHTH